MIPAAATLIESSTPDSRNVSAGGAIPTRRGLARRARLAGLGVVLAAVLATPLAACTPGSAASSGTVSPASETPHASVTVAPSRSPTAIPTSTSAWGSILDALPPSMPRYAAAADAPPPAEPVTAALTTSASVATVEAWYEGALRAAGYTITSSSKPAEDGSVVAEYDGSGLAAGCRVQLTFLPQGTQTLILVLVAAACPSA